MNDWRSSYKPRHRASWRWIVDGAERFHADGLKPPEAVRVATQQYRTDEDIVNRFVTEILEFSPLTYCFSSDIAAELQAWCQDNDIATPPRMNEIAATLKHRGANDRGRQMIGGKRSTKWVGVQIARDT